MAAPATPKPKSVALKELYQRLVTELDAPTLVVMLYSALDRKRLEGLHARFAPREGRRAQVLSKEELVGAVGGWFFSSLDVAHAVIRELDRVVSKERHIVASLPDGQIEERLARYEALDFRRERAKLVWALARDDRAEAQQLSVRLAVEMVQDAQGPPPVESFGATDEDTRLRGLRERLETYEAAVQEARGKMRGLEGQVARLERERAELIVTIGRKENALRAEEQLRQQADERRVELERQLRALETQLASFDPEEIRRLSEERSRLAQKLRRLEKKSDDVSVVERLRTENGELRQRLDELEGALSRDRAEHQLLLQTLVVRDRATQQRLANMRDALKTARQMALSSRDAPRPVRPHHEEKIGVFVDAANISASARRAFGGHFDFSALLDLAGERERVVAIAYVVDNGQEGFQAFAAALRQMGFTVKVKKPSQRPDGTVKADWDMAIAMDVIEARHRLDTVLIASGDGDFVPLVRRLKRWRKRVEVTAFEHAIHPELRRTADHYWMLGATAIT